jgi:hypothetical protein
MYVSAPSLGSRYHTTRFCGGGEGAVPKMRISRVSASMLLDCSVRRRFRTEELPAGTDQRASCPRWKPLGPAYTHLTRVGGLERSPVSHSETQMMHQPTGLSHARPFRPLLSRLVAPGTYYGLYIDSAKHRIDFVYVRRASHVHL